MNLILLKYSAASFLADFLLSLEAPIISFLFPAFFSPNIQHKRSPFLNLPALCPYGLSLQELTSAPHRLLPFACCQ